MLQQTQVTTVIPYFERFVARFPDLDALARASEDEVLAHWSGLGYYARARNLHRAARTVAEQYGGVFPREFTDVQALPGIGRSTAGAILAQAHGERHAILDGNAKRVLARHRAIAGWPGGSAVQAALWAAAEAYTPAARVAEYTQAIMDLGATLCTRSRPACGRCPVAADCIAHAHGTVGAYPGQKPARGKPLRATTMVLALDGDTVWLERRPAAGIWGGLWSLPETAGVEPEDWCLGRFGTPLAASTTWSRLRHGFSHYDLDITPVVARLAGAPSAVAEPGGGVWYRPGDDPPGGIAAPVRRLLDTLRDALRQELL
ncbi:MAG TPA: A/G-specific adenine glycosylase, partial [Woeseiaceae bacterium]|nr:A/G-specific adenine glycosylase [Woeseiaceae bacterium]